MSEERVIRRVNFPLSSGEHRSLWQMVLGIVTSHYHILRQLIHRDVVGRYRGTWLGVGWSIITPLMMLVVYSFVFGIVFKVRFGGTIDHPGAFAIMLYAGLLVHGMMAECLSRSPLVIVSQVNFVKKVVFPLEILPLVPVLSSLIHFCLGFAILALGILWVWGSVPLTILYTPLVVMPFVMLCLGTAWILAAVGVYLRDIAQLTSMLATLLLFLSPVFYSIDMLPAAVQEWVYLNPLTLIIEQLRAVAVNGQAPDGVLLGLYTLCALGVMAVGAWWFERSRKGFADVL